MLVRYAIAMAFFILWILPFVRRALGPREKPVVRDKSANWGLALQRIALVSAMSLPAPEVPIWRTVVAIAFGVTGILTGRLALRHLAQQWSVEAALNANHQLVTTGPYAAVRNPIYAGMFSMLLCAGLLLARWPLFLAAIVIFVIGTEIRVHAEEQLLRSRFGEEFEAYAHAVPAYVPFIR